ncbi:MAG TPA: IS30 family transposase, partial [Clostridiales bacterium]|nr:IS30 family transposase [Clostridiales bacterium]
MSQLEYNNNTRKNQHINFEERKIIERMLQAGAKIAEIAKLLLRDASTIKREIKRGSVEQQETV